MTYTTEEKQHAIEIAQIIFQQIFISVSILEYSSWGVSSRRATVFNNNPALLLKVNGLLHKGDVVIELDEGLDTYVVHLLKGKKEIKSVDGVYLDNLGRVIDGLVEHAPNISEDEYYELLKQEYNGNE